MLNQCRFGPVGILPSDSFLVWILTSVCFWKIPERFSGYEFDPRISQSVCMDYTRATDRDTSGAAFSVYGIHPSHWASHLQDLQCPLFVWLFLLSQSFVQNSIHSCVQVIFLTFFSGFFNKPRTRSGLPEVFVTCFICIMFYFLITLWYICLS